MRGPPGHRARARIPDRYVRGALRMTRVERGRTSRCRPVEAGHRADLGTLSAVDRAVATCERCPRLRAHCERVALERKREFATWSYWGKPIAGWGDPEARLVIVGLAPAMHGANRTGRMFTGDSSGDWLYEALHRFGFASASRSVSRDDGLQLHDCYITAAARCAPPANRPTGEELARCREYLTAEMEILRQRRVVVVLGRIAHDAWLKATGFWERLGPADRPQFGHGVLTWLPDDTAFLASYHPSRQNTNTRRLTRAMWHAVFERARSLLDRA